MHNAMDVAQYFLWLASQEDELVSNMKLQKLMYYAQGYHLARYGEPLFDGAIEAWDHGPVVPDVYRAYKTHGANALPYPGKISKYRYRENGRLIMNEVYANYGQFSAWRLSEMTHEELLWENAKDGDVISVAQIREQFLTSDAVRHVVVPVDPRTWEEIARDVLEERRELWEALAER